MIIGVGNEERGDDGAGLAVARRMQSVAPAGARVCKSNGDGAALMELWQGADVVWLVDAVRSGALPGTVHHIDVHAAPLPCHDFGATSHAFGVAQAVELARALGRLPARFILYGIEGGDYALGHGLSPAVQAAVDVVVRALAAPAPS